MFPKLEEKLAVKFKSPRFLKEALTHRSYLNEHRREKISSNERLEFLGDAVLEFLTSKFLYQKFPQIPEGKLTNLRSKLVCDHSLSRAAQKLQLGDYLLLSRGEEESGGRQNPSLLSNSFEAILGAIFLDQGLTVVAEFLESHLFSTLKEARQYRDYKSDFQKVAQRKFKATPAYRTLESTGPDHAKTFIVGVWIGKQLWSQGFGRSKQEAEQAAARKAIKKITAT